MNMSRRTLVAASAAIPLLTGARHARAAIAHYPLHCDPELLTALNQAALAFLARSEIRVHPLPTSDGLMAPQIGHVAQSDIVMTSPETLMALAAIGHDVADAPHPKFRGRLVLAALTATSDADAKGGPIAAPDPVPGARFSSAKVLDGMGLSRALIQGTIDTGEAAGVVAAGAARSGLMTIMDVKATPGLRVVAEVPDSVQPALIYIATTTQSPRRPHPEAFVAYLASPEGEAILAANGLDPVT
jgi:hypothetical protein